MIRIQQLKLSALETKGDPQTEYGMLLKSAARLLKKKPEELSDLRILRRSIDARDKARILYIYTICLSLHKGSSRETEKAEQALVRRLHSANISMDAFQPLQIREAVGQALSAHRPVIVGSGPCGLFAAICLIRAGIQPLILERGQDVDRRLQSTRRFFETGKLNTESNIQFGEGGAGTFSDGKLNTSIKGNDPYIRFVLQEFFRFGADEHILYDSRPHIGSDVLPDVVKSMRRYIEEQGGEVLFDTRLQKIDAEGGKLRGLWLAKNGKEEYLPAEYCILATGHSARDTYEMLEQEGLLMEQKAFAIGFRFLHPQLLIDRALYGEEDLSEKQRILGPAVYKLSYKSDSGRGVYSFCMCPGGYVVNSSSEPGRLCVNGMSLSKRDSDTANAAVVVTIDPSFYQASDPLAGMRFQRTLEEKAYALKDGRIPFESFREFAEGCKDPLGMSGTSFNFKGLIAPADLRELLPEELNQDVIAAVRHFGKIIPGYDGEAALMAALEARTSSPVRILRDPEGQANIRGIYPAGEGAGYAGGITSAAVDGIKTALNLLRHII